MSVLRRHLTYANLAATLALLFAMSGGALAANHYLINSTHQISPRVLKRLKGNRGPRGAAGIQGIAIQGPGGAPGNKGQRGEPGPPGPVLSTLPSGASESGVYGLATPNQAAGGVLKQSISFRLGLSAVIAPANIEYTPSATPTTNCKGPGQAVRGFLCIYSAGATGVDPPVVFESEDGAGTKGTGRVGFTLEWKVTAANAGDVGSYTVSAQ